uniref:ADF-H domain-containing protein n=1 Tax=Bigelowiella natans TaxID=227086 RepID=A0A6U3G755_BIGNA|mmetsp:Transcript_16843/g.20248  ORF Transcript_16843/g.20248 Transcript_16843/m.20248 type:complete len:149 (-) Transcript_16843:164-610(-)|eukprot:jgi/Bigna1/88597/estExt_fgenesh1_pg.C_340127
MSQSSATPTSECKATFKRVKLRGKKKLEWAIFKIDTKTSEIVTDKSGGTGGIDALAEALTNLQPRYAIFDHEFKTKDGRMTSKLHFISFTPENSNQLDRVIYAQSMKPFRDSLTGIFPISFSNKNDMLKHFGSKNAEDEDDDEDEDFD